MINYIIFTSAEEFTAKNNLLLETGLFPNSAEYANLELSKHPTENLWAMRVLPLPAVESQFDMSKCVVELSEAWKTIPRAN